MTPLEMTSFISTDTEDADPNSTLDKNHLSNLANLHHTISELLIG
jgi:hypothetical protein